MFSHKCRCLFIPPHVLESIARSGPEEVRESARLSIQQSKLSRLQRSEKLVDMTVFAGIAPPGQGPRSVYDCQNQWTLRVSLARSEGDPETTDEDVNKVYDYSGLVRDYLINRLGRNSYDNIGSDIIANVHVGVDYNTNLV